MVVRPALASYIASTNDAFSTSDLVREVCEGLALITLSKLVKIGMLY